MVTVEGISFNAGPVLDADHGYCLTQQVVIDQSSNGWITHTAYEDGEVVDGTVAVEAQKNVRFEAKEHGKTRYVSYGADAWPRDEYTRHLPTPTMPAFMVGVIHGKERRTGEWSFIALFVDKEGQAQNGMRAYIGQLKAMGFTGNANDHELRGEDAAARDRGPNAAALLAYGARNNAGFLVRVLCTGAQLCQLSLDNPTKAQRRGNSTRKTREEARRGRKQFDAEFADFVNSLPE
jgi:hypothetical protein